MKLGVISDSHVRRFDDLPLAVRQALAGVDIIVHAGDFTHRGVLDGLRALKAVHAVHGNMDSGELRKTLPEKEIFEVKGRKIGLLHGSGVPLGIDERVRKQFDGVDIIIFGHSHRPCNRYIRGVLLFNPGAAKDSFGLLTIDDVIKGQILRV
jgi:putative phosphoesterase